jgi:glyoxylase-like metal-dependent hydrolase (beta-lactamase superfamily II)
MALSFNTDFDPQYGRAIDIVAGVRRITAPNPGPYTFRGTNSYVIGHQSVAIVDPGPDSDAHLEAILSAIGGRRVDAILLTHSHLDHTPLTDRLKRSTGAPVHAVGPHKPYRKLSKEETEILARSADLAFRPDHILASGTVIEGSDWQLETVLTPGHTANHAAFAIRGTKLLLLGDHVMGWSTTVVAPPDGSMADYLKSLDVLLSRREDHYLPGHGAPVPSAHAYVKGLKTHRIMRERAILEQVANGVDSIGRIVSVLYRTVPEKLHGAAAMTVLAHLESLIEAGKVDCLDAEATLASRFVVAKR